MISNVDSYRYDESFEPHSNKWDSLVIEFSHLYRYQTKSISSFLHSIIQPLLKDNLIKSRHIETFTENKRLYRGRIYQNEDTLDTMISKAYAELGAPPLDFSSEKRMSAQGISSFYCSTQRKTCLPEIRPNVGDKAITGAFKPLFNLKLIKLKDLKNITLDDINFHSDPFDINIPLKIESTKFLSKLYQELIKPSLLRDPMTYRITQLFVEMLRTNFIKQIHGITFPSVQAGGQSKNIVLFPEFSEFSVTSNDKGDIYNPYEKAFPQNNIFDLNITVDESTFRPSLVFEEGSLIIHSVKSIKIVTEDTPLNR